MKHLAENTNELSIVYSRPLKRFLCFCLDIVVFIILGFLVFGVIAQPIISNMDTYKKSNEICETEVEKASQMYLDSHLAIFNGETYSYERAIEEHLYRKLQDQDDTSSTICDIFLYFYTVYAPEHLTSPNGDKYNFTIEQVNKRFYEFDLQHDVILWTLRDNNYNLPLKLTDDAKVQIKRYLNNEIDSMSEKYYLGFKKQADNMMKDAGNMLLDSKEYQESKTLIAINSKIVLMHYAYASIATYTLLFVVYYVVFPLLVGDGKTLGKYLLNYSCFSVDRHYIKRKNVVLRAILQFVSYFFVCGFLPFLQIGLNTFSMPIIIYGDYALSIIIPMLFSLLVSVISFFVMVTSGSWQSLADLCSKTIVGRIEEKPVDDKIGEGE